MRLTDASSTSLAGAIARQRRQRIAFLGGVVHDLRNPLGAMKLGVGALRQLPALAAEEQARRLLFRVDRQIDRLAHMLGDLLDAARIEAGELELSLQEVDVGKAAREMMELYAPTSPDHRFELERPDEPVIVRGDPLRIEQVISNLLSNAIKYSPGGGPVRIAVGADENAGEAEIAVEDRGVGIAPEEVATIFQPFRRRPGASKTPGAGLGLSVVKRIVEAHGGRVEFESVPGEGSTFRVRLPLEAAAGELSAPRRAS
jgi:signal transduction histidine kinase